MEKNYNSFRKQMLVFSFLLLVFTGNAQHFTVTLANFTSTSNTFEVDIVLIVDQPVQGIRFSALSTGIFYNPNILNGGTPCTTTDCGSFIAIPGSRSPELAALMPVLAAHSPYSTQLRTTMSPTAVHYFGVDLLPGTYTVDRVRFTNTVAWTPNIDAQLWLSPISVSAPIYASNTIVTCYPNGSSGNAAAYTTTNPANGAGLTLGYTQGTPMSRILNQSLATPENSVSPLQVIPNPFSTAFQFNFETISNERIAVKVYDMIGKLVESHSVESNAINTLQIGENYPSGIYNAIVSQGDKTQNARVIKR